MPSYTAADNADSRYILFGNMKNYYMGDRMALAVAQTDIVGFAKFQTHFRFVERITFKAAIPSALTALVTAAT
jgi:HK97 family phage major capsid protein